MNFARLLLAYPLYWLSLALFFVASVFDRSADLLFGAARFVVPDKTCAYHAELAKGRSDG